MSFENNVLYVTDLDGTLLGEMPTVPDKATEMLNRMIACGLRFSVATARAWASAKPILEKLNLHLPVVLYNGAQILDPGTGEILHKCDLSRQQLAAIHAACVSQDVCGRFEGEVEGRIRSSWMKCEENEGLYAYNSARVGDKRFRPVTDEERLYDGEIITVNAFDRREKLERVVQDIRKIDGVTYTLISDNYTEGWYWLSVIRADATKAMGVLKLKEMCGAERLICFGDNLNDLTMFEIADESCAVANAHPDVKCAATHAISSNTDCGVPKFIAEREDFSDFAAL